MDRHCSRQSGCEVRKRCSMKRLIRLGVSGVLAVLVLMGAWSLPWHRFLAGLSAPSSAPMAAPTVTLLETLQELVSLKINFSFVLVGEDEGYTGTWAICGD